MKNKYVINLSKKPAIRNKALTKTKPAGLFNNCEKHIPINRPKNPLRTKEASDNKDFMDVSIDFCIHL